MTVTFRPIDDTSRLAVRRLEWEAFGFPDAQAVMRAKDAAESDDAYQGGDIYNGPKIAGAEHASWPGPGFHTLVALEGGVAQGVVMAREFSTFDHDSSIPTCGVAGVTIGAEYRGAGLLRPLLTQLLREGEARGDAIATLYATAPGAYQRLGFTMVSACEDVRLRTTTAAAVRRGESVKLSRASAADMPEVRSFYRSWATAHLGAVDRTGTSFPQTDEQYLESFDAITLARDTSGEVVGYVCWDRGRNIDGKAYTLYVREFIAATPDAYRSLWRMLGSFSSVAHQINIRTNPHDPARHVLPINDWTVASSEPFMIRLLNVPAAFAGRRGRVRDRLTFTIKGDEVGLIDGSYVVTDDGARLSCERTATTGSGPVLSVEAISQLYGGVTTAADLASLGQLKGASPEQIRALDELFVRGPWQIKDDF